MKLLIADDDPQILRALKVTLGARGYSIVTAGNGVEALDRAMEEHPDVIMLDLGMPQLDGIEVIQGLANLAKCIGEENEPCEMQSSCNIISPIAILDKKLNEFYKGISLKELLNK